MIKTPASSPSNLLLYSFDEFQEFVIKNDYPKYKAQTIMNWVYQKSVFDFSEMSDLSKIDRIALKSSLNILSLSLENLQESSDGTLKFLFKAQDDSTIESVLILNEDELRYTACISSQVGCALRCSFCATGLLGFKRNLTVDEILSQVLIIDSTIKKKFNLDQHKRALDNIVFMGMGEPFLNFDAVIQAIGILNDPKAFDMGTRKITVSTAGIIDGIKRLAYTKGQIRLALSLHAANHEKRKKIMPIAMQENTKQVLDAVRYYQKKTNRRITIEYILIEGFNNLEEDVLALKHELKNIKYNLNIIPLNPVDQLSYDAPSANCINDFITRLKRHSIPYVLRIPKGRDIDAACGQLSLKNQNSSRGSL